MFEIGKKYNKLTYLEDLGLKSVGKKNRSFVKCQCECGKIVEIVKYKLGITKSCGCIKHEKCFNPRNLIGCVFGRLKVLKEGNFVRIGKAQKRKKVWVCECECGKQIDVMESSLLSNNTKSCGCASSELSRISKFNDLTGKYFGKLVVLKHIEKIGNHQIWECECKCGIKTNVRANNLLSGTTTSCGCFFKEQVTKHGIWKNSKEYRKYQWAKKPELKIHHHVSGYIRKNLKKNGFSKKGKSILDFLPYSMIDLKNHLENLWEPWMNWDNYGNDKGNWQIDHIIPTSSFSFKSMDDKEFKECWALSNLRPLEKIENIKKGNKIL